MCLKDLRIIGASIGSTCRLSVLERSPECVALHSSCTRTAFFISTHGANLVQDMCQRIRQRAVILLDLKRREPVVRAPIVTTAARVRPQGPAGPPQPIR